MVLTESELRKRTKGLDLKEMKTFEVKKGVIVTPSAKTFLQENNIKLVFIDDAIKNKEEKIKEEKYTPKYETIYGGYLEEKPEHMTQIYGNTLVFKDHPRIILRGKIDSLESKILETQILAKKSKLEKLTKDLEEVLAFVRNLLRCEVLNEQVGEFNLLNMNEKELREISHNPSKYFGMNHFFPSYTMGEIVISLNSLRTETREVELAAFNAFKDENNKIVREDIIKAFNRLSSLFWIMIFKYLKDKYK